MYSHNIACPYHRICHHHIDTSLSLKYDYVLIIRVTYITFISRTIGYFLPFPDDAVERRKLGINIKKLKASIKSKYLPFSLVLTHSTWTQ